MRTLCLLGSALLALLPNVSLAQQDILAAVQEAGVLRVCHADYRPSNFKDPITDEWMGIYVDVAALIAKELNVDLVNVDANWGTIPQSLATGKCDLSAAGTFVTAERAEIASFTIPVNTEVVTAFVTLESTLNSWDEIDREGIVVGVYAGSFEETFAHDFFKHAEVKSIVADKVSTALIETMNGRVDAYFSSMVSPLLQIKENPQFKLRPISDVGVNPTTVSFMVPKGDEGYLKVVNAAIKEIQDMGALKEIRKKWLGDLVEIVIE